MPKVLPIFVWDMPAMGPRDMIERIGEFLEIKILIEITLQGHKEPEHAEC